MLPFQLETKTWVILAMLCLALGAAMIWPAYQMSETKDAAVRWASAEGRMDEVEVVRKSATEYALKLRYTYSVRQKTYVGTTFSLGEDLVFPSAAEANRAVPAPTTMVRVRYYLLDPSESALKVDGLSGMFSSSGAKAGLVLVALGLACLVASFFGPRANWYP